MTKTKKLDAIEWLLAILLLITLGATAAINRHVALHVLDDDAASEMMLADVLRKEGKLYSEDYDYSTEFFFQNQIVFGFLFHFFDGWANVRFFGTCIIQCIYLASFVYMMSQSGLNRKKVLFSAILVMLPFTVVYGRTILYHLYYICNYIPTFLLTGLLFSFFKRPNASRPSKILRLFFAMTISFGSCFFYIRQIFVTMIPMMGCLFFYLLSQSKGNRTPYRKWMLLPILILIAGALGMLCNSHFLIPRLHLYEQTDQNLNVLSPASWGPILAAFFTQFGFRTGVKLFSPIGILSLGGLFSACVLLCVSGKTLLREKDEDFRGYLIQTMLPVSLLVNLVIFIFGDIPFRLQADYSRYLVPASVWIVPLLASGAGMKERLPHIRKLIYVLCTAIFILNGIVNAHSFLNSQNFDQPYDGISYDNPHLADDLQPVIEFIKVHDYSYGYAFAGAANTLVELMNGLPVTSLRLTPDAALEYTNWLTVKSYKTIPAERAFFVMSDTEALAYEKILEAVGAEKIYFDDNGYVLYDISDLARFREHIREP